MKFSILIQLFWYYVDNWSRDREIIWLIGCRVPTIWHWTEFTENGPQSCILQMPQCTFCLHYHNWTRNPGNYASHRKLSFSIFPTFFVISLQETSHPTLGTVSLMSYYLGSYSHGSVYLLNLTEGSTTHWPLWPSTILPKALYLSLTNIFYP